MRVLHILDHSLPVQSGYAFRSHSILLEQQRSGLQPIALTSPKHYESVRRGGEAVEQVGDICYHRSAATVKSHLPLISELRLMARLALSINRMVLERTPDVLHPHSPTLNVIPAILVGKLKGIPVVYEIRSSWEDAAADRGTYGSSSWKYRLGKWLETWACRAADAVVVICDGLKKELIDRGIAPDKITVVPNGVSAEFFSSEKLQDIVAGGGNGSNRTIIGFMGSFFRWEGLDQLIDAMARLTTTRPDVSLILVGGGEMEGELRARVKQLNLEDHVIMAGQVPQSEIPAWYARVDIMAFPRYSTKLTEMVTPLKPLEAMAMRKVVVASDVGGHKELIRNRETGLLFRAGNVDALVNTLREVLDDQVLRRSLQEQALLWVRRERMWACTIQPYLDVYKNLQ